MTYAIYINKNYAGYKLFTTTKDLVKLEMTVDRLMSQVETVDILVVKKTPQFDEIIYYGCNKYQEDLERKRRFYK